MAAEKGPSTSALAERITAIEEQNKQSHNTLQDILAALGALAPPKTQSIPLRFEAYNPVLAPQTDNGWTAEQYWIRLKPYNKAAGMRRMRTLLPEIGRPIDGGTGLIGNIPEWVRVDRRTAMSVSRYRQNDENPSSPPLLDIVTDEERQHIDETEARQRMAGMGLAGMPPAEVFRQANLVDRVQPRTGNVHPRRTPPTLAKGAEAYQDSPPPAAPSGHTTALAPTGGRGRALDGLPPTLPPAPIQAFGPELHQAQPQGRDDGEDFARTAARSAAIDAQIAHVEALGPIVTGNLSPR